MTRRVTTKRFFASSTQAARSPSFAAPATRGFSARASAGVAHRSRLRQPGARRSGQLCASFLLGSRPPKRAIITVIDPESNRTIGQVEPDMEGAGIIDTKDLALPPGKEIKYVVSRLTWDLAELEGVAALPPTGTPIELELSWSDAYMPPGVVSGTVRFDDGSPAVDATVTFASVEPGIFSKTEVRTDSEGKFSNDEVYGLSGMVVTAHSQDQPDHQGDVRNGDGQEAAQVGFRQCSHRRGKYIMKVFSYSP